MCGGGGGGPRYAGNSNVCFFLFQTHSTRISSKRHPPPPPLLYPTPIPQPTSVYVPLWILRQTRGWCDEGGSIVFPRLQPGLLSSEYFSCGHINGPNLPGVPAMKSLKTRRELLYKETETTGGTFEKRHQCRKWR